MDIGNIISFISLGITVVGVAIGFGRFYQRQNDMDKRVVDLETTVKDVVKKSVEDATRTTRLEEQYLSIAKALTEIKTDVRTILSNK